jgi:hypothetical protein
MMGDTITNPWLLFIGYAIILTIACVSMHRRGYAAGYEDAMDLAARPDLSLSHLLAEEEEAHAADEA